MLKQSAILLFIILTLNSFTDQTPPKKSDWYTLGLKGKVKKMVEYFIVSEDTISTNYYFFNKEGYLEKFELVNRSQGHIIFTPTYDNEGYTKNVTTKNNSGTTLYISELTKELRGDTVVLKSKKVYNISSDQSEYEQYFVNHLMVKENMINFSVSPLYITTYEFDKERREVATRIVTKNSDYLRVITYEKSDKRGNWTRRKYATSEGGSTPMTQSRFYSYY